MGLKEVFKGEDAVQIVNLFQIPFLHIVLPPYPIDNLKPPQNIIMVSINFGNPIYWQKRYKQSPGQQFDWLLPYPSLKPLLSYFLTPTSKILLIGCGNSPLCQHLFDDSYTDLTCIDFSKQVISQMTSRYHHNKDQKKCRTDIKFKHMDAGKMEFEDGTFDVVIDKCVLDAVLCAEDATRKALRVIREVNRVLKMGGKYLMFSHSQPKNRVFLFRNRLVKMAVRTTGVSVGEAFVGRLRKEEGEKGRFEVESNMKEQSRGSRMTVNKEVKVEHYFYVCTKETETKVAEQKEKKVAVVNEDDEFSNKEQEQHQKTPSKSNKSLNRKQKPQNQQEIDEKPDNPQPIDQNPPEQPLPDQQQPQHSSKKLIQQPQPDPQQPTYDQPHQDFDQYQADQQND